MHKNKNYATKNSKIQKDFEKKLNLFFIDYIFVYRKRLIDSN